MGGRKAPSVRRCLLRPLHRPARRKRQDAANVPCEGNVQCQDGSLTLYAGAKSPGVDRESNWLPASARSRFTFAPTGRGAPSSMVSGDRRLSSEYNRAVNYGVRDVVPRCERGRYIERRLLAHSVNCCGAAPCPELGVNRTPSPTVSIRRFWG